MATSSCSILLFLSLLFPFISCTVVVDPINLYCGKNLTAATAAAEVLQSSLNRVLPDLVTRTPTDGYAISSYSIGNNTLYGLTRCRGDLTADACLSCIAEAARKLLSACSGMADARIWYDHCLLRYDTDDFIGTLDTRNGGLVLVNDANATDPVKFGNAVAELMETVSMAASVPGNKRFAWGLREFDAKMTIRGMAQCTRDLPVSTCEQCLASAVGLLPRCCEFRPGCQVIYSSCVVRYEIYDFLFTHCNSYESSASPFYKIPIL